MKSKAMRKKKKNDSIEHMEEELKKYNVSMSDQMKMELALEKTKKRRVSHTSLRLFQFLCVIIIVVGGIFYFAQEQEGNYVLSVYLDQENLYRKGIDISETEDFQYVCSHLNSHKFLNNLCAAESEIPDTIHIENEGSLDGDGYMAYSFFIRNAGLKDTGYQASLSLNSALRHSEKALRVKVWRNDEVELCKAGNENEQMIYQYKTDRFLQGFVDKYTVIVWVEKNDSSFREEMAYGKPQLTMRIEPLQD